MSEKRRNQQPRGPQSRGPRPLTATRLEELALAYVARFATTQAKLRGYLQRKLYERGWDEDADEGEGPAQIDRLIARYADKGYVDDASWARMKAGSLLRRGYGARRVGETLGQAGVDEATRAQSRPGPGEQRRAAVVLARRRRFGPFALRPADDPKVRDRQLAAMLRAGHPLDIARRIVESDDTDALEEWAHDSDAPEFGDY